MWRKSREPREDWPRIRLIPPISIHEPAQSGDLAFKKIFPALLTKPPDFLNARVPLLSGLEQLNGIAVGIFYLYLLATGTNFHFVPEMKSRFFHRLDLCG
jgi:hypothetical protein